MMNPVIFFFFIVFSAILFSTKSHAALNVKPTVPGYTPSTAGGGGMFKMSPPAFGTSSGGYTAPGNFSIGGKPFTAPASMPLASNAGQFAKNALKLNPWAIAGTLAAGWLLSEGFEWIDGQWQKQTPDTGPVAGKAWWIISSGSCATNLNCTLDSAIAEWKSVASASNPNIQDQKITGGWYWNGTRKYSAPFDYLYVPTGTRHDGGTVTAEYTDTPASDPYAPQPATEEDWDALPSPLPDIQPEFPDAPYSPEGAPVGAPEYDFAPYDVPIGEPYAKPDGSTVQPMAKVSPNGDGITVDTYDQPLTNPDGSPVSSPVPQDTPEPQPDQKTDCDKKPESLGCADIGTVDDVSLSTEERSPTSITPVSVGGAGSCPSPLSATFLGQPVEITFDPLCTYATSLRPLVLALAWLSAGLVFIGGVRN